MPHNFKILSEANISFVSKAGIDNLSRNSADPNFPLRTIAFSSRYGSINIIAGAGQYVHDEAPSFSNTGKSFTGDGKVIVSGGGNDNSPFNFYSITIDNLEVTDYQNIIKGVVVPYGGANRTCIKKCILRRGNVHSGTDSNNPYGPFPLMKNSICINANVSFGDYNGSGPGVNEAIINNIFIASPVEIYSGYPLPISLSYFDASSPLTIPAPAAQCLPLNCNIRGALTIEGVSYANLSAAAAAWPALLTRGNFNSDPRFNKPEAEDFTLKLSSPHLDKGVGPTHLRYAKMYYVLFSGVAGEPCTTQNTKLANTADGSLVSFREISGFTVNEQGGLVIIPNPNSEFEAYYITDKFKAAATPQPITSLPVVFAAKFNSDYPSSESAFNSRIPEVYNNNVPARNNYTSGSAGRNPHRLTILARFSPNAFPDVDNPNDWVANSWMEYEIGVLPTYNAVGAIGNGSPNYDPTPANVTQMVARWIQIHYRARNNYYSQ